MRIRNPNRLSHCPLFASGEGHTFRVTLGDIFGALPCGDFVSKGRVQSRATAVPQLRLDDKLTGRQAWGDLNGLDKWVLTENERNVVINARCPLDFLEI